jgi:hypothetical protein
MHPMSKSSRRQLLAAIGFAGIISAGRRVLAGAATDEFSDQVRQPGSESKNLLPAREQSLVKQCGLKDAPWLKKKIFNEFEQHQTGWGATRNAYRDRCESMLGALAERQRLGFACPVADQIFAEARWLALSTTDKNRILKRFADFDEAFEQQKNTINPPPIEQSEDGSWAPYVSQPFQKLDISIDYINRIVDPEVPPSHCNVVPPTPVLKRPLTFLRHWADADAMVRQLRKLQRSAIHKTGRWNRQEYSSLLSTLAQLMFKKPIVRWLRQDAHDDTFTENHSTKFIEFLDDAQDSCTGCWRHGYDFADGTSHDAYDLSNLYHIVQYRREGIKHWNSIVDGLIAVRQFQYPQGPVGDSHQADHNIYDVVRIAIRCLDEANPPISSDRRSQLMRYVRELALDAVMRLSMNYPSLDQAVRLYAVPGESNYFTVKLLHLIGFWSGKSRFLKPEEMSDRRRLAEAVLQRLVEHQDSSPMSQQSIALLKGHLGYC